MKKYLVVRGAAAGVCTLGLCVAVASAAGPPVKRAQKKDTEKVAVAMPAVAVPEKASEAYALSQAMMRVFLDPQSGELREPSAAELAEIGRMARRVSAATVAPEPFALAGGGVGVEVPAEHHAFASVRADGEDVVLDCHEGEPTTETISVAPVAPAAPEVQ